MPSRNDDSRRVQIVTIKQLSKMEGYAGFTEPALRHLIFESKPRLGSKGRTIPGNGLEDAGAIIRVGRRVLIDLDRFDAWLDSHRISPGTFNGRAGR